jgi:hypothetical protein
MQPLLGLTVLRGLRRSGDPAWEGGEIYNPDGMLGLIWGNFRNGPLSVKPPSDDLATVIVLPSVVDMRSPHHAIR